MEQFVNAVLLTVGLGAVIGILCTLLGLIRGKNAPEDPKADPAEEAPARTAVVCCTGIDQVCSRKNDYQGPASCAAASTLFGGSLTCPNACLGGGDCRDACPQKAIVLRNGLAVVDSSRYDWPRWPRCCLRYQPVRLLLLTTLLRLSSVSFADWPTRDGRWW